MNIQEDIDDIMAENGRLTATSQVTPQVIAQYQGKLPELLTTFWLQHGVGSWKGGLFTLCLPSDFKGLLSQVFGADPDFSHQDCHVIGYSAFGHLLVWNERHWVTKIDLMTARISCPVLVSPEKAGDPNIHLSSALSVQPNAIDAYDDNDNKLFAPAVRKIGRPGHGEAFGFFPALALGGTPALENIRIVPALEHFLFLAQIQPFKLVDYLSNPPRIVRDIG
ncbi:MAG: GAD-like domain-containing protein [Paracoccaceae bacterium]